MNTIPVTALPKIGWFGTDPLEHARFDPVGPVPLQIVTSYTKPTGGLWCSPVVRAGHRRQIVGTAWTTYDQGQGGIPFTLVKPHRNTRVARIDSRADLRAIIDRWPDRRQPYEDAPFGYHRDDWGRLALGERPPCRVDWPAMAADVDAVYLTSEGIKTLNLPHDEPHLWGWDVPTVLFLNPTFSPGRVITPPDADTVRTMHVDVFRRAADAAAAAGDLTAAQAAQAKELLGSLLTTHEIQDDERERTGT